MRVFTSFKSYFKNGLAIKYNLIAMHYLNKLVNSLNLK